MKQIIQIIAFFFFLAISNLVLAEISFNSILVEKSGLEEQYHQGKLPINLKVTNNCMFGDFDAIKQDMLYSDKKKLIMSLQSLSTGEEKAVEALGKLSQPVKIKKEDSLGDVMQDFDSYFKVLNNFGEELILDYKVSEDPELYLLRICKDSTDSMSCKSKPYVTVLEVIEQYKNPGRSFKPEDRVYYAQLVSIDSKKISFLSESISEANQEGVVSYLSGQGVQGITGLSAELKGISLIRSLPLNIHNNKLQVVLPSFDPVKCGQQQ